MHNHAHSRHARATATKHAMTSYAGQAQRNTIEAGIFQLGDVAHGKTIFSLPTGWLGEDDATHMWLEVHDLLPESISTEPPSKFKEVLAPAAETLLSACVRLTDAVCTFVLPVPAGLILPCEKVLLDEALDRGLACRRVHLALEQHPPWAPGCRVVSLLIVTREAPPPGTLAAAVQASVGWNTGFLPAISVAQAWLQLSSTIFNSRSMHRYAIHNTLPDAHTCAQS